MINDLKFVQGAVARKDFIPALTHFRIKGGTILGYNGTMALSSPIALDIDCNPRATPFIKAIQTCKDTVQLHMTPSGRLAVKSGKFTAYVECCQDEFPRIEPEGQIIEAPAGMVDVLTVLAPFIAEDASRPWARGILFRGQSAYVTNNIILAQRWMGVPFPVEINVPKDAVAELIRIGEQPSKIQVGESSITFLYESGRWLRSQLSTTEWPDVDRVLDTGEGCKPQPVPEGLFEALESLKPFAGDDCRGYMLGSRVSTGTAEDCGASVEVEGLPSKGCFNIEQLLLLRKVVKTIDFEPYPAACPWFGDMLRGVVVGMYA